MKRIKCRIRGRVQLVMFRDFTKRKARRLGLVGTVQNLSDGSVSVIAEGDTEKLKQLAVFLKKGSLLARVDNAEVVWGEASGEFSKFDIVYSKQI